MFAALVGMTGFGGMTALSAGADEHVAFGVTQEPTECWDSETAIFVLIVSYTGEVPPPDDAWLLLWGTTYPDGEQVAWHVPLLDFALSDTLGFGFSGESIDVRWRIYGGESEHGLDLNNPSWGVTQEEVDAVDASGEYDWNEEGTLRNKWRTSGHHPEFVTYHEFTAVNECYGGAPSEITVSAANACGFEGQGLVKLTASQPEELRVDDDSAVLPRLEYQLTGEHELDNWTGSIPVTNFWFWDIYDDGTHTLGYEGDEVNVRFRVVDYEGHDSEWATFPAVRDCAVDPGDPGDDNGDDPGDGDEPTKPPGKGGGTEKAPGLKDGLPGKGGGTEKAPGLKGDSNPEHEAEVETSDEQSNEVEETDDPDPDSDDELVDDPDDD